MAPGRSIESQHDPAHNFAGQQPNDSSIALGAPMADAPTKPEQTSDLEVAPGIFLAPSAMRFQFARSGGPGGQNVNKLNTKAELWVNPNDLRGLHPEAI